MNCRTNPTVNAPCLHLGHLYLTLVNAAEAKSAGGRLIVRWDDVQAYWVAKFGPAKIAEFKASMKDDLDWAGIDAEYTSEADSGVFDDPHVRKYMPEDGGLSGDFSVPEVFGEPRPYPFVPHLTAAKVILDYEDGIDPVIRGNDLVSENALYCHFCTEFGYHIPHMVYVGKLKQTLNYGFYSKDADLADVSKSATTGEDWSIKRFREEVNPGRLIERLAEVCLVDPKEPWLVSNVREQPKIGTGWL